MEFCLQSCHTRCWNQRILPAFLTFPFKSVEIFHTFRRSDRRASPKSPHSSYSELKRVFHSRRRGRPSNWTPFHWTSEAPRRTGSSWWAQSHTVDKAEQLQAPEMEKPETDDIIVLDMEAYFSGESDRVTKFCHQLREQCHKVGFFYVKNHGVPEELCDSFLELCREFFKLPTDLKMQLDYRNSPQFRGYMKIGAENTNGLTDFREQIDLGPEEVQAVDVVDGTQNTLIYPVYRRLHGPNQWPPDHILPNFKTNAEDFMIRMGSLSMHIMQALALSLGLRKDFFDSSFLSSAHYQMKVVRYPPKSEGEDIEIRDLLGVGEHSDSGFLSLLLQDDVGGLQAQTTTGAWTDVPPKKGTFVVNLGEMLQLATGGYYLATVHRVLSHTGNVARYSIPFFFNPRLDTDIRTFNIAISGNVTFQDTSVLVEDNDLRGGRSTHNGKNVLMPVFGHNVFKSFARSHPGIVKEHHPDLLQSDGSLLLSKIEESR